MVLILVKRGKKGRNPVWPVEFCAQCTRTLLWARVAGSVVPVPRHAMIITRYAKENNFDDDAMDLDNNLILRDVLGYAKGKYTIYVNRQGSVLQLARPTLRKRRTRPTTRPRPPTNPTPFRSSSLLPKVT
jgi:hypothetical protein